MPARLASLLAATLFTAATLSTQNLSAQATHTLLASPTTVVWGNYNAKQKPALTVKSGDTVIMQTLSTCGPPERLKAIGIAEKDIPAYVTDVYANFPAADKGPGGHILTGPVAIEGADIGDVLEVRIQKVAIDTPWACNSFGPGRGFLPDDFPYSRTKLIPIDREKMTAAFAPGIVVPVHPFFGSMGLAPPEAAGKYNSAPPWMHAGNMDNRELVAGSTLFIPVNAKGALFQAGDGHANQGNGEVDITAMETNLTGTFQFILHKAPASGQRGLLWPRAETPDAYISMGFNVDLKAATEMAIRNMITFLAEQDPDHPHLSREDAYALISTSCDVDITQLVDTNMGVHVICPKKIFVASR